MQALKVMIPLYNYIVAAGVPKVRFVDADVMPRVTSLCADVLKAYNIDRTKISPKVLQHNGCD